MDEKTFTWIGKPNEQALGALLASIAWFVAQKIEAELLVDGGVFVAEDVQVSHG